MPDYILQEIRDVTALHCREICMTKKAKGADTEKQMEMHAKAFLGTEAHQSVLDLFLKGSGPYFAAFEKEKLENNRAGNEARAEAGYMLELKELLHCDPNSRYAVFDPGFTREDICTQHDGTTLSGRILYDKGLQVVTNYKHAVKHYLEFTDANQNNPSGTTLEDMLMYVRQKMHVEFKGGKNKPTGRAGMNRPAVDEENMPAKYVFNGYFAFVLFGPRPLSSYLFSCLSKQPVSLKRQMLLPREMLVLVVMSLNSTDVECLWPRRHLSRSWPFPNTQLRLAISERSFTVFSRMQGTRWMSTRSFQIKSRRQKN